MKRSPNLVKVVARTEPMKNSPSSRNPRRGGLELSSFLTLKNNVLKRVFQNNTKVITLLQVQTV